MVNTKIWAKKFKIYIFASYRVVLILSFNKFSILFTYITILKCIYYHLEGLINQFHWLANVLMKSEHMHHSIVNNFKNDRTSIQLVCFLKYVWYFFTNK